MTLVQAILVLFGKTAPAGADFQAAFSAAKGKKFKDLSGTDVRTLDEIAESFQDFTDDPDKWLKNTSSTDARYSWWSKLAQELGAAGGTAGPSQDTPSPDVAPEQGIDPDALAGGAEPSSRPATGNRTGGGRASIGPIDDENEPPPPPKREKKRKGRNRDEEDDEEGDRSEGRREHRDQKPPEPPPPPKPLFARTRTIPEITKQILASEAYLRWRDWIIEAYRVIREGTVVERGVKLSELGDMRSLIDSMKLSLDQERVQAAYHLERLMEHLQKRVDKTRPSYFDAYFKSGNDFTD